MFSFVQCIRNGLEIKKMNNTKSQPRCTPDRDSRYMALSWIYAGFSKDPSTQVGACIVSSDNMPLGMGYNGPPRQFPDHEVIWDRPSKENPDAISKYDLVVHAEINAIDHSFGQNLRNATLYVTALPCPDCMLDIVRHGISRVVYFDYQSSKNSMLQNSSWRDKTFDKARRGRVSLTKFEGNVNWVLDWVAHLKQLEIFGS